MYYIYVLISLKDRKFYVGFTTDLKRRFHRHEKGEIPATRYRRPFKLLYFEGFANKKDALVREKYLKSGYGRDQLKNILKNSLE